MIPFETAFEIVMDSARPLGAEAVPISNVLNRILAQDVASDTDIPPFNKSAMDGYACRREDLSNELTVIEEIPAGYVPRQVITRNQCAKIMTGGIVPEGADCVIMVEFTENRAGNKIIFTGKETEDHICLKAEDVKKGEIVLRKGTKLMPHHIAVLATVGCVAPLVSRQPRIGIVATGNELVEPGEQPSLSQIRNSNSYQLCAQVTAAGAIPTYYGIAKDTAGAIDATIKSSMVENDVIILSGGVSMGEYDLVPDLLKENNFKLLFEKVGIKPGRPTVFGVSDEVFCFGLPGNPVSTFVIFELIVKPFLYKMMGFDSTPAEIRMRLDQTITREKVERTAWIPVAFTEGGGVAPVEYHGSGHLNSLSEADGLISIPVGISEVKEGTVVLVRPIQS